MFTVDTCTPTKIILGAGRLKELATAELPGKKALICMTPARREASKELLKKVKALLKQNGSGYTVFDHVGPNPTKASVEEGAALAEKEGCDYVLGLGGGSAIDCGKAIAMMMKLDGDLWDYGYTGSGGRKTIDKAAPIVAVTTTCGTGTEADRGCVITNQETGEKLDFIDDVMFPRLSIIDPELMVTLPEKLTIFQGFDGLFHAAECFIMNQHKNKLLDLYALTSVKIIAENLMKVVENPADLDARSEMAYACDILSGYCMVLCDTTSLHLLGQSVGGLFPQMPHGATLIAASEAYVKKICPLVPEVCDELGETMGKKRDPKRPGYAFVEALTDLMDQTGCRKLSYSDYGITDQDIPAIVDMTCDQVGISDCYELSKQDMTDIVTDSIRK